jgi:hypothetical protein
MTPQWPAYSGFGVRGTAGAVLNGVGDLGGFSAE